MKFEWFIAQRLIREKTHRKSVSSPIMTFATSAIAVGILMMLIAMATGFGLQRKIREKVSAFHGHIQISDYDNNHSEISLNPISSKQDFYPDFDLVEGVSHIQAVAVKAGIIRTEETFEGILAKGVGADFRWDDFRSFLTEGRIPDFTGNLNNEVLLSSRLASRLQLKLGDTFYAFFLKEDDASRNPNTRRFKIVGLYDSGFEEFDSQFILTDIRHIQRMNQWEPDQVGRFELFVEDFDDVQRLTGQIYENTLSDLNTQNVLDRYYTIFEWIGLFDFNIAIIIGIMIIVGGINMITALLVLVLERTPMIGILKALGASNWSIRKIFMIHAVYLIGVGLVWGNLVALTLVVLQDRFHLLGFPNPQEYYMKYIPVFLSPLSVILLNLGVLVACTLMLLVPSLVISRIPPVRAIKFS